MKALVKLLTEFIVWRWAPAIALLAASTLYVVVVVGLVPSEIGVPVANAKFAPRDLTASTIQTDTTVNAYANAAANTVAEAMPVSAPPRPVVRTPANDFGRRGFSPPIERPEPLGAAPTPSPPPMSPTRGPLGGIFSRIQGALRPGTPAAQALNQAALNAQAQNPQAAQNVTTPSSPAAQAPVPQPPGVSPPPNQAAPLAPGNAAPPAPPEAPQPGAPPDQPGAAPGATEPAPEQPPTQ
jgi:hypothetical protein